MSYEVKTHFLKVSTVNNETELNITDFVINIKIDLAINNIYNTIVLSLDTTKFNYELLNREFKIEYGGAIFTAISISYKKKHKDVTELYCRTIGAKLYKPFLKEIKSLDYAIDTDSLIEEYSNITGVNINNMLPNLKLNGAFKRGENIGDGIQKVLNLLGGEIYENNNALHIRPTKKQKSIEDIVIDFIEEKNLLVENSIQTKGIGTIIISNKEEATINTDIIADIYTDTGEVRLFTKQEWLPLLENNSTGLMKPFMLKEAKYSDSIIINNSNYIQLPRYAKEVTKLLLNNTLIDYKLNGKVIEFNTEVRGIITLEYIAEYQESFLIPKVINYKRYGDFEVFVEDEYLSWFGELEENTVTGNLDYEVVGEPCSNIGFDIYFYNDKYPEILLYVGAELQDLDGKITYIDSATIDKLETINLTLNNANNKYEAKLKFKNPTVKKVRVGGQEVTNYTLETRDNFIYIQFDNMYYNVDCLYTLNAKKVTIQYTPLTSGGNIKEYLVLKSLDINAIIELNGSNCISEQCEYPHEHTFNIAKILNVPIDKVVGQTIQGLGTINEYGEVKKTYTADGIFTYDTNHLRPRTKIIFKANVNGTAGDTNSGSSTVGGNQ